MKRITILLPVLLAVSLMSFAAPHTGEEDRAKLNFARQFAGVENVKWSQVDRNYQKASFLWGGHRTEAYFDKDGRFVGAIRGLFYQQLPLAVAGTVDRKYENRVILSVREISNAEGTSYSVLMDWKGKRYNVKLQPDGAVLSAEVEK